MNPGSLLFPGNHPRMLENTQMFGNRGHVQPHPITQFADALRVLTHGVHHLHAGRMRQGFKHGGLLFEIYLLHIWQYSQVLIISQMVSARIETQKFSRKLAIRWRRCRSTPMKSLHVLCLSLLWGTVFAQSKGLPDIGSLSSDLDLSVLEAATSPAAASTSTNVLPSVTLLSALPSRMLADHAPPTNETSVLRMTQPKRHVLVVPDVHDPDLDLKRLLDCVRTRNLHPAGFLEITLHADNKSSFALPVKGLDPAKLPLDMDHSPLQEEEWLATVISRPESGRNAPSIMEAVRRLRSYARNHQQTLLTQDIMLIPLAGGPKGALLLCVRGENLEP